MNKIYHFIEHKLHSTVSSVDKIIIIELQSHVIDESTAFDNIRHKFKANVSPKVTEKPRGNIERACLKIRKFNHHHVEEYEQKHCLQMH